jgi:hypothetical protein
MAMSCAKILVSFAGACWLLTLPARSADSGFLPKSDKIENAKDKLEQLVRDRNTFNPLRHKGDLAIVVSVLGVVIGGGKFLYEFRRNRRKQDPRLAVTPQAGASQARKAGDPLCNQEQSSRPLP